MQMEKYIRNLVALAVLAFFANSAIPLLIAKHSVDPTAAEIQRLADRVGTSMEDRVAAAKKEKEERQKNMTQPEKIEDNCNEEHKLADYSPNHIVEWCVIRGQRAAGIYVEPTTQETTNTETTASEIDVSKGLVEPTPIEQQPVKEKETTK